MALSDLVIRKAPVSERVVKLSDGGGLQLWISPGGTKAWKLAFRFEGKQKTLTIGPYPQVTLAAARKAREAAKADLAEGIDPAARKQENKERVRIERLEETARAAGSRFRLIAEEVLTKKRREGLRETTLFKVGWMHAMANEAFGDRPIGEIKAVEILDALRKVEHRGNFETANRMRSVIGEVFRYAIATGRASYDPTQALKGAIARRRVKHRAAIVDPREVGALMRAIDAFRGQPTTVAALKLMAYCYPRPGELRQAKWAEFDLEGGKWSIPADRMKMKEPFDVPLSKQAVAILKQLHRITGDGALVFPGYGMSGGAGRRLEPRPMSEGTMIVALRRMGYDGDTMTPHGFRATASTLQNASGLWPADVIEKSLAHEQAGVRKVYNRAEYWPERVAMAQWWGDHLDELRSKVG